MCKGNCCCCHRCAEQLHARDPSSIAKDGTSVGNQQSRSDSREKSSPRSITNSGVHDSKGATGGGAATVPVSTVVVTLESDASNGEIESIPSVNNYLAIKELLHAIEEEDDQLEEDPISPNSTFLLLGRQRSDGGSLSPWCRLAVTTTTTATASTSAQQQYQQKCENRKKKRGNLRIKSSTIGTTAASTDNTTTCISGGASPSSNALNRMQAEQGSIGDLQKYHNRYLRNRRHTLANVR